MKISIIAAMDENRVIGYQGQMPWHLPADLKHFRQITMGKPIIMGRKTYESIGKPLDGRTNIIVTRNPGFQAPDCTVTHSLEEALQAAASENPQEAVIIGGGNLYTQALPLADTLYLTQIQEQFNGDTYFPAWEPQQWQTLESTDHNPDAKNPYAYRFLTLTPVSGFHRLKSSI